MIDTGERDYMAESDVGGERDPPHAWVIEIDAMSVERAREIGRLLGEAGVTGRFLSGDVAENLREYAQWRKAQGEGVQGS